MALPKAVLETWTRRNLHALADRIQELIDAGLPVEQAERMALEEFAGLAETRALRGGREP
jgi:hypothetical protein